jgi:hypothetical protein
MANLRVLRREIAPNTSDAPDQTGQSEYSATHACILLRSPEPASLLCNKPRRDFSRQSKMASAS